MSYKRWAGFPARAILPVAPLKGLAVPRYTAALDSKCQSILDLLPMHSDPLLDLRD